MKRFLIFVLVLVSLNICTLLQAQNPEPTGWYAGDMHVHRSCGSSPVPVSTIFQKMSSQDLAAVSLLADMGNGEVQNPTTDLPLVNGSDDPVSTAERIVHWDAEWHWDATYSYYAHQALGGHLVALGLTGAHQIWDEYTFPILSWAHQQNAVAGFVHMQYLDNSIPQALNCCIPIEYPVEVALGSADFVAEDVDGNDYAIDAYYRLLNSGFRPGFAAGTDYPCNDGVTVGSPLTYVRVGAGEMTYRNWIDGISYGKTVVSRNGHNEFLDLNVSGSAGPGDEINLSGGGNVPVTVQWTATQTLSGTIELVANGVVVASKQASVTSGSSSTLTANVNFTKSGWLAARRTGSSGHALHTAAVFVIVDNAPVRTNATDPQFYVQWMDNLLSKTSAGGEWNWYFPTKLTAAQARYQSAKSLYQQIAVEAQGTAPALTAITVTPGDSSIAPGTAQQLIATGTYSNGNSLNITGQVTWSSSDTSVAKVNLRGLTAAVNGGQAVIYATLGDVSGSTGITVQPPPSLVSIAVAPNNSTILVGNTQQFTATGTYSNNSTKDITGQVTWISSNTTVAGITTSGFATAIAPGTSTISASLGSVSGGTTLTVQPAPLTITTTSLPNGLQNQAYSANLLAIGGTPPYTWSVAAGSVLPAGISLSPAGQLSGTPVIAGTSSFTTQVKDSVGAQASQALSLAIIGANSSYSIWNLAATPSTLDVGPDNAVELGVNFKADQDGSIAGIRFYKSTANTGTHVGNLWTSTGTKLASATFSGETASGWQQVNFATPVPISAGTIYVASYHTDTGHYSDDQNYFATKGVDNPPLHALQNGAGAGNGVFAYGTSSVFPSQVWYASNYWVDVVLLPAGPDTKAPTVYSVAPSAGASGVDIKSSITATFSESIDPATVNGSTFSLLDSSNAVIPATISYNSGTNTATLVPTSALAYSTTYKAVIKGGTTDPRVKDMSGNAMASDFTWSFTTAAPPPPPPNEGPGGPILVVSSSSNPFSRYYSEVLRAEGLNEFTAMDISLVSSTTLSSYDLVILGDIQLDASQATMFSDWVTAGGNLIALHPDKKLAGILGLSDSGTTLAESYLKFNTTSAPGVGLVGQTIQFHGSADRYTLNGASTLATLYSDATTATANPAVTLNQAGLGQAAAFTFDLARSIIYTRQGNPAWSGQARDGQSGPIRSDDLFFGRASFDPQRNWVDLNKVAIPQADEQQRFLANLILQMNQIKRPLPRFWYFPNGYKAAVVLTGDDHGSLYGAGSTAGRFDQYIASSPAGCSVADWRCVRATSYVISPSLATDPLTNAQAQTYAAKGFEISVHVDSNPDCGNWTYSQLDSFYTTQVNAFKNQYTSVPAPRTHRMHCVSWSDYDSQPIVESKHGIRLDTTYYYWPPTWVNDVPGMFTGSGMPMRFTDRNGNFIDVYQATTQMTDESGQSYPLHINTLLDNALGTLGYYGFFTANMHNDYDTSPGAEEIVASALSRHVPVISAAQLLTWLDGRNGSSFGTLAWNGGKLTFTISVGAGANGLQAMLPANSSSGNLTGITLDDIPVQYTSQTIKGVQYGVFSAAAGTYEATYSGSSVVSVTSLVLDPSSVTGGASSIGTVTLSGPAPTGGASVALTTSDSSIAPVPLSVSVPAGSTTATFTINTNTVTTSVTATVTASYAGSSRMASLTVAPSAALSTLTLNPTSVVGGGTSTATVTLTQAAPAGGAVVALSSANTNVATVPATVTIAAGSTTATFTVTTIPVGASTPVSITATYGANRSAALTVNPPAVSTVALNPSSLVGGNPSTGNVTLSGPAPAGGASVALTTSDSSIAPVPLSVSVPAGSTTATFTINTTAVTTSTTVTITASYAGSSATASLTVTASAALSTLGLNPTAVVGGMTSTGTVTLTQAAPAGGAVVALSNANTNVATVPATVTIAAGSTTATFTVTTIPVGVSTPVSITATYGANRSATLTVNPSAVSTVALNPSSLVGGNPSTGTVTLSGPAPAGGASVALTSTNTTVAPVPANVTVNAGATTATFTINTTAVTTSTMVTITASYAGSSATASLTVTASAALSTLGLNPTSVVGGRTSTGTVTLTQAAPAGGAVVALSSANTNVATVPATVTIAAGSITATFTITTTPVSASTPVSVTANYRVSRSATLIVNPPAISTLALSPTAVTGGASSKGTVTLTGTAPTGGVLVILASGNTAVATVPQNVTVPAGSTSATFPIATYVVATSSSSSISARFGTVTRASTLTVRAAALSSLALNPATVRGGTSSTGTVTLTGAAPSGGILVALRSSNTYATVPASVTVPAGSSTATFTITTGTVTATRTPTISATYGSVRRAATLTITP